MIQIALYKKVVNWDLGAWIIRLWTSSEYSHCELVIDGISYSCSVQDGGVRAKPIALNTNSWDYLDIKWADEKKVLEYFQKTSGRPYGWGALIRRQLFNIRGEDGSSFCSEWCAAALGIPNPGMFSPASLTDFCKWVNESNLVTEE